MSDKITLQQKVKVLQKLFDNKICTEKDLQALDLEKLLDIPNVSIMDIRIIVDIQKQSKANKLFSYLGGGTDVPSTTEKD